MTTTTRIAQRIRRTVPVRMAVLVVVCLACLLGLAVLSLTLPTPRVAPGDLLAIACGGGTPLARVVVIELRLPRLVLGVLAGAMLGLSGMLLQSALRNVLAGPELLGVTSGATIVVAAITILHLPVLLALIPWLALLGGLIASGIVILSMRQMQDPVRLVLIGVALTALLNACVIVLVSFGSQVDTSILFLFLVGSLANRTWPHVQVILPWAAVCIPLTFLLARSLNVLQLGEHVARGLGVPVARLRLFILVLAVALVAAVVAVCGPIAFVALLAPHLARRLLRSSDARIVLPVTALAGSVLLTAADLVAHVLFDPMELPVGLWTTLIGGPLLLVLLRQQLIAQRGVA